MLPPLADYHFTGLHMAYLRWGAPLNFDAGLATGETDPVNAFVA